MINLLVTFGHHEEEKDIGREVCTAYKRMYHPSAKEFRAVGIEYSSPAGSTGRETGRELLSVMREFQPLLHIDLHHCSGWPLSEWNEEKTSAEVSTYLNNPINAPLLRYFRAAPKKYHVRTLRPKKIEGVIRSPSWYISAIALEVIYTGTAFFELEMILVGYMWKFPKNRINQRIFNNTVCWLNYAQNYSR